MGDTTSEEDKSGGDQYGVNLDAHDDSDNETEGTGVLDMSLVGSITGVQVTKKFINP